MKRLLVLLACIGLGLALPPAAEGREVVKLEGVRFSIQVGGNRSVGVYGYRTDSDQWVCVSHYREPDPSRTWDLGGVVVDCAFGTVEITPTLATARVQATVPTADPNVGDFVVDTTHVGLYPTTERQPPLSDNSNIHNPRGTSTPLCFDMGTYSYTAHTNLAASTQGTVTWDGQTLGPAEWGEIYRRIDARGAARNC